MRTWVKDTTEKVGEEVTVAGWVHARRNMGKIIFIDLRDRSGLLQVVFPPENAELMEMASELRPEDVVRINGIVKSRPEKQINENIVTGTVEFEATNLEILNKSKTPPFELDKDTSSVSEEVRLKYRYLDLRTERMQRNLKLRDDLVTFCRQFLHDRDFIDIETPYLTRGTPEGAREFLVPSRLHPGTAYVLPQAPQQFKQLLMIAGIERYFQFARCFRDEDQRGDRQPEFTQLDMEMSFVEQNDVMQLNEDLMIALVNNVTPEKKIQSIPFPRLSYQEAIEKYGTDRPDLRKDKNDPDELAFCWVVDFPFFEKTDAGGWTFTHNPFSAPKPEHMDMLMGKEKIDEILTTQYDLILNGFEIGGGSIRNHNSDALRRVFEIIGLSDEEIESQFAHFLGAFKYGTPPHGGIAWGFERLVMVLANEPNIREVTAFPKTGDARDLMMGAPSKVSEKALKDAHIKFTE